MTLFDAPVNTGGDNPTEIPTLPTRPTQIPTRRCVACGRSERYFPNLGPWIDRGAFQPARECGAPKLPPIVLGPLCPDCKHRQPKAP